MRIYETIFILRPDVPEEEIDSTVDQISTTITEGQGTIDKVEKWGKRRLAYQVKRHDEGYYVLLKYTVPSNPGLSKEVERRLKVLDPVIKYLTVRIDEELKRIEKMRQKREKRTAKKPPRETGGAPGEPQEKSPRQPVAGAS